MSACMSPLQHVLRDVRARWQRQGCRTGTKTVSFGLQVAFDPLDGSSVIGANFAVGAVCSRCGGPVCNNPSTATKAWLRSFRDQAVPRGHCVLLAGSIFGIWPGGKLTGRSGRDQAAAAYGVYGSRTTLVLARPRPGALRCAVLLRWPGLLGLHNATKPPGPY